MAGAFGLRHSGWIDGFGQSDAVDFQHDDGTGMAFCIFGVLWILRYFALQDRQFLANAMAQFMKESDPIRQLKENLDILSKLEYRAPNDEQKAQGVTALEHIIDLCGSLDIATGKLCVELQRLQSSKNFTFLQTSISSVVFGSWYRFWPVELANFEPTRQNWSASWLRITHTVKK